jgi:hypothetical protein
MHAQKRHLLARDRSSTTFLKQELTLLKGRLNRLSRMERDLKKQHKILESSRNGSGRTITSNLERRASGEIRELAR